MSRSQGPSAIDSSTMRTANAMLWRRNPRGLSAALFLVLCMLLVESRATTLSPVEELKQRMVQILRPIVDDVLARLDNRKSMLTPETCRCSYHVCGEEFPEMQCLITGAREKLECGEYSCEHMQVGATVTLHHKLLTTAKGCSSVSNVEGFFLTSETHR